jgi:hypothetical protein
MAGALVASLPLLDARDGDHRAHAAARLEMGSVSR